MGFVADKLKSLEDNYLNAAVYTDAKKRADEAAKLLEEGLQIEDTYVFTNLSKNGIFEKLDML